MIAKTGFSAVLFDMDGLLLDTEPLWRRAWQEAADEYGFEISNDLYLKLVGLNPADTDRELLSALGEQFPVTEVRARRTELWGQRVDRDGITPKAGVDALLDLLESSSIPWAIATSSDSWAVERCLQASELAHRFPVRATSDQVGRGKPCPDLYLRAAELLETNPADCLALEDSDVGATAAIRAGAATLVVPDLKQPSDPIRQQVLQVLPSLDAVAEWLQR